MMKSRVQPCKSSLLIVEQGLLFSATRALRYFGPLTGPYAVRPGMQAADLQDVTAHDRLCRAGRISAGRNRGQPWQPEPFTVPHSVLRGTQAADLQDVNSG